MTRDHSNNSASDVAMPKTEMFDMIMDVDKMFDMIMDVDKMTTIPAT